MEGSGRFLVLAVGIHSQTGIIMSLLGATQEDKTETNKSNDKPKHEKKGASVLQAKLGRLALQIGYCGITGALITFTILVISMIVEEFIIKRNKWSEEYIKYIVSFMIQAITVIVVAVPEGLPLAVTLALAFAVRVS